MEMTLLIYHLHQLLRLVVYCFIDPFRAEPLATQTKMYQNQCLKYVRGMYTLQHSSCKQMLEAMLSTPNKKQIFHLIIQGNLYVLFVLFVLLINVLQKYVGYGANKTTTTSTAESSSSASVEQRIKTLFLQESTYQEHYDAQTQHYNTYLRIICFNKEWLIMEICCCSGTINQI